MTKLRKDVAKDFKSLDASLLLNNSSSFVYHDRDGTSNRPFEQFSPIDKNTNNVHVFRSGGFDNVCFDLESLEEAGPGSRKPLVSVNWRTLTPEEYVLSTLSKKSPISSHLQRTGAFTADSEFRRKHQLPSNALKLISSNRKSVKLLSSSCTDIQQNNGLTRHSKHPNSLVTAHTLYRIYKPYSEDRHFLSQPKWNDHCRWKIRIPGSSFDSPAGLQKNRESKSHWSLHVPLETGINSNLAHPTKYEGDKTYRNNLPETNFRGEGKLQLKERESETHKNIIYESLPSNYRKKMETLAAKKTENGLVDTNYKTCFSFRETMVRVGGVIRQPPPNIRNVGVPSSPKTVSRTTDGGNISQVSVMNNLNISSRVSNVVITSGGAITPSALTVSALSKVSSVRIVPSPVNTPSPSIIGGASDTSSVSSQPRSRPLSLRPNDKFHQPKNAATIPPPPSSQLANRNPIRPVNSNCNSLPIDRLDKQQARDEQLPSQPNTSRLPDPLRGQGNLSAPFTTLPPTQRAGGMEKIGSSRTQRTPGGGNAHSSSTDQNSSWLDSVPLASDSSQKNVNNSHGKRQTSDADNNCRGSQGRLASSSNANSQQANNDSMVSTEPKPNVIPTNNNSVGQVPPEGPRRVGRERRRERRERRRERRALRSTGFPPPPPPISAVGGQTELAPEPQLPPSASLPLQHLPDLLNSHIPPPYNSLPNGPPRLIGPPPNLGHPLPLQIPPLPPPIGTLGPFPPHVPPGHGSPLRPPPPENFWHFFGSRRSRGSPRCAPYLGDEEAKSCCGLLVTQAVSIRWFIIMIAFVGLCCTVVGTVLGAVKTNSSEYVTITLLMIGVGIVLITVSGVAWHLTSRDAPCRVMLGLTPSGRGDTRNRFIARMAPTFGRPHHPYAAMIYPEFQYRPPPPSYQASMQEYRLRLLLLDRQGGHHGPFSQSVVPSPPPTYRPAPFNRLLGTVQESDYSRPPSYRSREGSVTHHPDAHLAETLASQHSRDPSCLSFLSHESLYSTAAPGSIEGSTIRRGKGHANKIAIVGSTKYPIVESSTEKPSTSKKLIPAKDDNTVTIVQTTDCSHVIGSESVIVTVSGNESLYQQNREVSVLAHL